MTSCTNKIGLFVVYHNGPNDNESPFFFQRPNDIEESHLMCTCNFDKAQIFRFLSDAEILQDYANKELAKKNHPLAGKVKIGELCVSEMKKADL